VQIVAGPNANRVGVIVSAFDSCNITVKFGAAPDNNGDGIVYKTVSSPYLIDETLIGDAVKQSIQAIVTVAAVVSFVEIIES
jgi:hypothetical protein